MEVVRDRADNCIIVCSIENVDAMGVHTGDSVTVAPALTLTDSEYQRMRDASIACLREIGVDTGGSNVQFGVNPADGRMVVIEMNPRVSRSSALASKATGFPIAKVAAKLAVGYTLDELANDITTVTPASFEPTIDYVVVKIPRFTFEKFPGTPATLTTSHEVGGRGDGDRPLLRRSPAEGPAQHGDRALGPRRGGRARRRQRRGVPAPRWPTPRPDRVLMAAQAMRAGVPLDDIHDATQVRSVVPARDRADRRAPSATRRTACRRRAAALRAAEGAGLLRQAPGAARRLDEAAVRGAARAARRAAGLQAHRHLRRASSPPTRPTCTRPTRAASARRSARRGPPTGEKIIILGGGPNRIGQGIEFDYCCVHAAYALKEAGFETIMVNCNPETVSTDYDTSDRLYFEPLTAEDVIALVRGAGERHGAGLHRAVRRADAAEAVARRWHEAGIPILGTSRGGDRHRRGPRALPAPAAAAGPAPAGERHRPHAGGGGGRGGADRLSGGGPPLLRARRPRHGDRAQPRTAHALRRGGGAGLGREPDPDRPVPRRRHRGRRGLRRRRATARSTSPA